MKDTVRQLLSNPLTSSALAFIIGTGICSFSTLINGSYGYFDSIAPVYIGMTLISFWLTVIHACQEADRIDRGVRPNHTVNAISRVAMAMVVAFIPSIYLPNFWISFILIIIHLLAVCYFVFDPILNTCREYPLFYVSKEPNAALSDRLWRMVPGSIRPISIIIFKFSLIVITTFYIFKSLN